MGAIPMYGIGMNPLKTKGAVKIPEKLSLGIRKCTRFAVRVFALTNDLLLPGGLTD